MSAEKNKAVIHRLAEAVNQGKLELVDEILASDYVRHDPSAFTMPMWGRETKTTGVNNRISKNTVFFTA